MAKKHDTNKSDQPQGETPEPPADDQTKDVEKTVESDADGKTFSQAELDKILSDRLAQEQKRLRSELEAEREKARREAEETRLREQEDFRELADRKTQEAEEAQRKLERFERNQQIDALLDKHDVTTPDLRRLIRSIDGDLETIEQQVQGIKPLLLAEAERIVNGRLGNSPPPKSGEPEKPKSLKAQYEDAVAKGEMEKAMAISARFEAEKRKTG